jgi:hypothetical protein
MRTTSVKKLGLGSAILLAVALSGTTPAFATSSDGTASLGSSAFGKANQSQTLVDALAPCDLHGAKTGSSGAVVKSGVTFGGGTSSCTTTTANGATTTKSVATGKNFDLTALVAGGGPRIRMTSYSVTCNGSSTGTNAGWSFGGLSGVTGLPAQIPSNYVYQVKKSNGTVLAEITFGEYILPDPSDGSISLNALHIRFQPGSGYTGDITLGSTACSPVV